MWFRVVALVALLGWNVVKSPPAKNFAVHLHRHAINGIIPLGSKLGCRGLPSLLSRAVRLRTVAVAALLGWSVVNTPPLKSCRPPGPAIERTKPFAFRRSISIRRAGRCIKPGDAIARVVRRCWRNRRRPDRAVSIAPRYAAGLFAFGLETVSACRPGSAGQCGSRDRRSAVRRERCEIAADQNLAVRLHDGDANRAIGVWVETVERGLPAHRRSAACQPGPQRKAIEGVAFLTLDVVSQMK